MPLSRHTRTRLITVDGKKVRAHRWIMEQHLGRKLLPTEEVHHLNHDPLDNRIENLVVMDRVDHIALHAEEKRRYPKTKLCVECSAEFRPKPRRAGRQKTCGTTCAQQMRVAAAMKARGVWA